MATVNANNGSMYPTPAASTDNRSVSVGVGSQTGSGASSQNSSQNSAASSQGGSTSTTNSTSVKNINLQNMSPEARAILNQTLLQLSNGGTPQMLADRAQRKGVFQTVSNDKAGYSKEAAFTDATALINQQTRRVMESLIPSISRAAEDAGSSGGALRALLLQDAGNKAAESGAALGAKQATDYGNISSNLSQILERLSQTDNTAITALASLLNTAKGAVQTGTETTNTTGTTVGTTNNSSVGAQVGTQNNTDAKQTNSTENKASATDYAPFSVSSSIPNSTLPQFFGATTQADPKSYAGSSVDFLSQLQGGGMNWNGYRI